MMEKMINAKPILFTGDMVRAILDGRKTQTRRIVKDKHSLLSRYAATGSLVDYYGCGTLGMTFDGTTQVIPCPHGKIGDYLYVKENAYMWHEKVPDGKTPTGRDKFMYRPLRGAKPHFTAEASSDQKDSWWCASVKKNNPELQEEYGLKNPVVWRLKVGRFLPRKMSRLTLQITDIRVERVQDITTGDCYDEGIYEWLKDEKNHPVCAGEVTKFTNAIQAYSALWDSINAKRGYGWETNPWVWAISFKPIMENTDEFFNKAHQEQMDTAFYGGAE